MGLAVLLDHLEGHVLAILLDGLVTPFAADETLGIEDGVLGVGGQLVLGGITDQALALLGECDVGRSDTVAWMESSGLVQICASQLQDWRVNWRIK